MFELPARKSRRGDICRMIKKYFPRSVKIIIIMINIIIIIIIEEIIIIIMNHYNFLIGWLDGEVIGDVRMDGW